jgi:PAS domain S-box-containing protein
MASPSDTDQDVFAPAHRPPRGPRVGPVRPARWAPYAAQLALLAAAYFGAAKVGLTMAFVAEQVTAVWPPTGIALAALLVFGYRTWPAVALGAFLANATANAPPGIAAAIALGNTLEALLGAWLLRRAGFDNALGRVNDVLTLGALAAGVSTAVSATVGATSLCLAGLKPWSAYPALWSVWWLGDVMGDLVVAPLLLTWAGWRRLPWRPRQVAEAAALLLGLAAVSLLVFARLAALFSFPPLVYAVFPFVIWAALRFGQPGATLMTFVASSIAIWGTVRGHGPFAFPATHESLILLLVFLGVVAVTALVLAAVTAERERAKGALQQNHGLLRAVVEGATDAVFVKDRRGRYLMINAAGARFLGKPVAEVIGKDDTELFSPETAREIMGHDRRVMAAGEAQTFEDVGTAAGVTRTYLSTKVPYRDARGNVVGVIGISRDISERKRAEERFRLVVESAPCGMLMVNREGRIVLVNSQTEALFGHSRRELLGRPVELLLPDRFRAEHAAHCADFFANPMRRVMGAWREVCGRRRDSSEFPLEVRLTPLETAEGLFVLSALADVSERKRAEETQARLAAIVESSEDAIFAKGLDGTVLTWNRGAERMYGYTAAEAVGRPVSLLAPPELAGEVPAILEQLRRGEYVENYETVRLRKDGTRVEVSLTISPMRDKAGRLTGASAIACDITARKRAERRLAAAHAVTAALARSASLAEAAASVLRTVGETLRCDLGVLWQVGPAAGVLRCAEVWHAPGVEGTEFERFSRQVTFARGEGLPGRAWDTGELTWAADAPFPRSVAAQRQGPCGALALPLQSDDGVLGVLEFFSPGLRQPDAGLFPLLADLGSQVAQFIQRRQAETAVHVRERELSLARTIQQGLLPKAAPALPGFEVAGATHPAQETGGDYFDFIPLPGGDCWIALGDASGHGIGAALLMAAARAYLRALAVTHTGPDQVLDRVNQRLAEDVPADHFVTLFLARLSPRWRSLAYSSAGHLPGYVLDKRGEVRLVLPSTGVPLSLGTAGGFPQGPEPVLGPGELVLLLSDGIVEARSGSGQQFGIERTLGVVRAHRGKPPGDIVAALLQEARAWSAGPQADDMTVVVLKTGGAGD